MFADRYTRVAIGLHWLIAGLILFNLGFGFFMEKMAPPLRGVIMPLHVSSGVSVLALSLVRLLWRLIHKPPELLPAPVWQRNLAHLVHAGFYALMLLLPLSGVAILSCHPAHPPASPLGAGPAPELPKVWGLFQLPVFSPLQNLEPTTQKSAHEAFVQVHSVFGWIMLALLVLHVFAALKHQLLDRQPQFKRMGLG
jgi:cytochrome b561